MFYLLILKGQFNVILHFLTLQSLTPLTQRHCGVFCTSGCICKIKKICGNTHDTSQLDSTVSMTLWSFWHMRISPRYHTIWQKYFIIWITGPDGLDSLKNLVKQSLDTVPLMQHFHIESITRSIQFERQKDNTQRLFVKLFVTFVNIFAQYLTVCTSLFYNWAFNKKT